MASITVALQGFAAAQKAVDKYIGRPFEQAVQKATLAGARVAAPLVRRQAPVGATKRLSRSVRARKSRRDKFMAMAGASAPHSHLVIRGHRIVTPGGRDTGLRSRENPFVDRAVNPAAPLIIEVVKRELFRS